MIIALLIASSIGSLSADDLTVDQVLDKIRAAVGYQHLAEAPDGIVEEGTIPFRGQVVPYRFWFDASGRFVENIGGAFPQMLVHDGWNVFDVDVTGMPL